MHACRDHGDAGSHLGDMEARLRESQAAAEKWRGAFREVALACGYAMPSGREPDVGSIVESIKRLRTSDMTVQASAHSDSRPGGQSAVE